MAPRHWPPPSNQLGQKLNPVSLYRVYMGSRSCECDVAHADWVPPVRPMFQSPCWRRPLEREGQPLHVLVISPINLSTLKSPLCLGLYYKSEMWCCHLCLASIYTQEVREGKVPRVQFAAIEISTASLAADGHRLNQYNTCIFSTQPI